MDKLLHAVVPDFPSDRSVKATKDSVSWYKIVKSTSTLLVPPENVLRVNMMELDRFIEAVKSFATTDVTASEYNWEDLTLEVFGGNDCKSGIQRIHELLNSCEYVACDIETRRVEWEDNRLLAIGFAVSDNHAVALHSIPESLYPELQEVLSRADVKFIWHNGKFDCSRLKYLCNITARVDEDTMLKHYAQVNEKRGSHGLKDLGQLYLQAPAWDDELDRVKKDWCRVNGKPLKEFMYDDIPTGTLVPYMQRDCIATFRLFHKFDRLARPGSQFIYEKLIEASEVYMQVELAGMRLDTEYMATLADELEAEIASAGTHLVEVASKIWDAEIYASETGAKMRVSEPFNPKSPKQLKWMLKQVLGHEVDSTDAATMQGLIDRVEAGEITAPLAREFIESIGTLRKYSKYRDTYVEGFRSAVCRDGKLRGTFNLHGTETGRLSSSNPNMQNIPRNKAIKNLIIADPGYRLVQFDYSQAELRVLAMLSEDPWLIQTYVDGKDLHDAIAEAMFGQGFDSEQRNLAKTINFGIAYGRGPSSIAEKFNKSMPEAREMIDKWFRPMPKVREFIETRRKMPLKGEPCFTLFGRERHFVITNENLNHVQNEYINTPIQSLASDLTMFSLLEIHSRLRTAALDAQIITTVHDSIIVQVVDDEDAINQVADIGVSIMAAVPKEYIPDCKVPFRADVEIGYKWGSMQKRVMEVE